MKAWGNRFGSSSLYFWLAVAVLFPMWGCVAGRDMFFLIDALHNHFPFQAVLSRILAGYPGELPVWDPYIYSGSPLLADPQRMIYYPPALFYRLLPFAPAFGCFLVFHLFLAAAGMAAFLRARGLGNRPAGLGAMGYALGASPSMLLGVPVVLSGYAWLPWTAYFAARLRSRPGAAAGMGPGLSFVWLALAGYPQYVLYAGVATALILWLQRNGENRISHGGWLLLASAVAAVLVSAQYVPFAEYLFQSNRSGRFSLAMANTGSLRPWDLVGFLSPLSLMSQSDEVVFGAPGQWTTLHFCGVLVFALAVTAAVLRSCRQAARLPCVMIVTGVLLGHGALIPAIGPHLLAIPPLGWIRHAGLWLCLAEFGLAWLAAVGLAEVEKCLFSRAGGRILAGWTAGAILLASMGITTSLLKGWMLRNWPGASGEFAGRMALLVHPVGVMAWGLLFLWLARRKEIRIGLASSALIFATWAELHAIRLRVQPVASVRSVLTAGPTERFLQERMKGWFRVFVTPRHQFWRVEDAEGLEQAAAQLRDSLRSSLPAAAGLLDAEGDNPLRPRGTEILLERAKLARNPWGREARAALQFLGVKFLISKAEIPGSPSSPVYVGHTRIYEMVGECRPAWIEPAEAGAVLEAENHRPGFWEIRAKLSRPATLVLSESFVKGWKLEGGPAGTIPAAAHGALVGVSLPVGEHTVKLRYAPGSVKMSLVFSGAALAGLLILGLAGVLGRRRAGRRR